MKFLLSVAVLLLSMFSIGCSSATPGAGEHAVFLKQPWIFGHGGVDDTPVTAGQSWCALSTQVVIVDMKPLQERHHFDDLMSKDGVPLDFDAIVRIQVTNSVEMVKKFGPKWYETNVRAEVDNRIRQAVRKHGMNETAIDCTAQDQIDKEVTDGLKAYLTSSGVPAQLIQVTVGKANPPDSVKSQRIETAAQQQRILTEQQGKLAEDQRAAREKARAKADNAYREEMKLSPAEFIELQRIGMLNHAASKGVHTFIVGDGKPVVNTHK